MKWLIVILVRSYKKSMFKDQTGTNMLEISMYIGLAGLIVAASVITYATQVRPAAYTSSKYDKFNIVMQGVQKCYDVRGSAFPLQPSATPITTQATIGPFVGSSDASISTWTYTCTAGGALSIVATLGDAPNTDSVNTLTTMLGKAFPSATITAQTASQPYTVTYSLTGQTCS